MAFLTSLSLACPNYVMGRPAAGEGWVAIQPGPGIARIQSKECIESVRFFIEVWVFRRDSSLPTSVPT